MSKDLGYQDNTAGPGKQSFVPKGKSENKHGNAPQQDGTNEKKAGENAGDCLSNNNGTVNNDPS